jgi:hypothetical protein
MKMLEVLRVPASRWLIGRLSEHRELTFRLSQRPDLLVIEADPLSGTSAVLAHALNEVDRRVVFVDARGAADAMDLGMAIGTAAIESLAPAAASWWNGHGRQLDFEGLRISRVAGERDVDLDELQIGGGASIDRLRDSLELLDVLTDEPVLLAIDHLDTLLERVTERAAREVLGALRAYHQRLSSTQMLLVGLTAGRLATGMRDRDHPLYRAGEILPMQRPKPQRFIDDFSVGQQWTSVRVETIGAAAELAAGAPAYVWRIVDLVVNEPGEPRDGATTAWGLLRDLAAPTMAQEYVVLAGLHRAAPTVASAISSGLGPYELPVNPKSINDALRRMRARGVVFSPEERRWSMADPLLASWARVYAPDWVQRRARVKS